MSCLFGALLWLAVAGVCVKAGDLDRRLILLQNLMASRYYRVGR